MIIFAKKTVTRRSVLKRAVAAGAVASVGPWFVRDARSSSGELNWFTWEDYAPKALMDKFTKDTGIKINVTLFDSNETQLNKLRAARGEGFDMCTPTVTWVGAHIDAGNIQPVDWGKIKTVSNLQKTFQKLPGDQGAQRDGKYYCMPYTWGTEALAFSTKAMNLEYGKASFGDLWDPKWKGKMVCRPRSIMLGTGLWMEGKGDIPAGSMKKSYDDEATMVKYYGMALEYSIKNKAQIGTFWQGTNDTVVAYRQEGCVIGQTWDGPPNTMRNEGDPIKYLAPKEGALTWCDTLSITKGAKNLEQVYEYMQWALQPEVGGLMANETGYNSIVVGAEKHTNPNYQRNFSEAYPGDAIDKLWFQGEEKPWFIAKRQEFAAKLQAA
ncbi:MAG: extracellular solute-binding protein [Alphaproteobacteria bacterium]|nr:extracellular solute-binding protein [Alphaproteobacteria bacterium]